MTDHYDVIIVGGGAGGGTLRPQGFGELEHIDGVGP
jgi:hypothetical protein